MYKALELNNVITLTQDWNGIFNLNLFAESI